MENERIDFELLCDMSLYLNGNILNDAIGWLRTRIEVLKDKKGVIKDIKSKMWTNIVKYCFEDKDGETHTSNGIEDYELRGYNAGTNLLKRLGADMTGIPDKLDPSTTNHKSMYDGEIKSLLEIL